MDAYAKSKRDRSLFSLTSAWQQKEMHDKHIAKIKLWVAIKNLAQTLKTHENISLHPISTFPPKGEIDVFI